MDEIKGGDTTGQDLLNAQMIWERSSCVSSTLGKYIGFKGKDLNECKIEEVDRSDRFKEKVQRE